MKHHPIAFSRLRNQAVSAAFIVLAAFGCFPAASALDDIVPAPSQDRVAAQMHNVTYHYTDSISVHLIDVGGELVPTSEGRIPVFDDKQSFTLRIASARIAIDTQSLANVLNGHVFAGDDAELKDIAIRIEKGQLHVTGKLHKKGGIGFEIQGRPSVTDDGQIRLHAEKISALHLPVKGIMDLFGLDIADLIKSGKVRGVRVENDDLIIDPAEILPPPRIEGRLTQVSLESNQMIETFGDPQTYSWARIGSRNYMAYRGGRLKFGRLTMEDTDLILIDEDSRDAFDFYLDHYREQLSAGFTKITPNFGLRTYMVDYNKLKRGSTRKSQY